MKIYFTNTNHGVTFSKEKPANFDAIADVSFERRIGSDTLSECLAIDLHNVSGGAVRALELCKATAEKQRTSTYANGYSILRIENITPA